MTNPFNPLAALIFALALGAPAAALAQDAGQAGQMGGAADALMSLDGTAPDTGIAAETGWHSCDVVRTGAGWGNHYVALTCPQGPFTNKWHILNNAQKDAMLATALAAATSDNQVQVFIQSGSGGAYNEIQALYLQK